MTTVALTRAALAEIVAIGQSAGLAAVGVAPAAPFTETRRTLIERKASGLSATMQFTYRNPERSTTAAAMLPSARSLVVGAYSYWSPDREPAPDGRPVARVARYARHDHYAALRAALGAVADHLRSQGWKAVVVADENALVDREAAVRAGLGWYGKSTNVLLPGRGSWFVLGSVVTDAALPPTTDEVGDGCGSCHRCLDACPTGAIVAPGVVDARRCLAWLVQAEGSIPIEFRRALGDRLYGCDDCQEVCPPNRSVERRTAVAEVGEVGEVGEVAEPAPTGSGREPPAGPDGSWVDVVGLLSATDDELLARHGRWYIPKREPRYLRRNALVVLGNSAMGHAPGVASVLERYLHDDDPMLREHARWAADELGLRSGESRAAW